LVLFHQELNLYGFVGIIMLIGIVKKNAIMMIDFALDAQRAGRPAAEAIFQGCLLRFRPIMMTTMAALMATLPIAVGVGAGSDARRSLGLAVVRGLVLSRPAAISTSRVSGSAWRTGDASADASNRSAQPVKSARQGLIRSIRWGFPPLFSS